MILAEGPGVAREIQKFKRGEFYYKKAELAGVARGTFFNIFLKFWLKKKIIEE